MSLLLEAMKEAAEARRQADGKSASTASVITPAMEIMAEPALTATIGSPLPDLSPNPLPDLSRHFDTIDADLAAISSAPPTRHPPLAERSATRRLETGNVLLRIAGVGLLSILGVGGYFWWQLQTLQSPSGVGRPVASSLVTAMPSSAAPSVPAPLTEENGALPPTSETALPLISTATEKFATLTSEPIAPIAPSLPTPRDSASADTEPRQTQTDTVFRLTHASPQANTVLEHAYEALQSGQDAEAQRNYEQVLRADVKNTDALLGLATLAARQGQVDTAHDYYLRALEANPNDSTARAGVLSTGHEGDDDESLLKTALTRQPDSPSLLFALGNLHARQRRWSEAQQAYFQAYASESDNPDIIFNLAVSLDHLRQNKLAAQYYRMALNAGDARTAAFDRDQVGTRLLELQP